MTHGFIDTQTHEFISEDEIFFPDTRIGIHLGKEEDGFYKQIFMRLRKDAEVQYRFACVVEIAEDYTLPEGMVTLGGDSSQFLLKVNEPDTKEPLLLNYFTAADSQKNISQHCYGKVILLSDSYLPPGSEQLPMYANCRTQSFRFLKTTVATSGYTRFDTTEVDRSQRYELYRKGSVFYFDTDCHLNEFTCLLDGQEEFIHIGYNTYITLKNKDK